MAIDPSVVPVNSLNFDSEVRRSDVPVLVDVSTAWCAPCRLAAPVVAELAKRHAGRLKVVAVDGDEAPELAAELGVRGFPTFLGFVGGHLVARKAGFGGKGPLASLADELVEAAPAHGTATG